MNNTYPLASFSFVIKSLSGEDIDSKFQSVSGLSTEIETEEYSEGGENRFKHQLPTKVKYPNLILKRGLVVSSAFTDWCRNSMENFEFRTKDLTIALQSGEDSSKPSKVWSVVGAYPVKWEVSEFNAEENKLAIETVELKYKYFTIKK
ncbi:phage tail protein [Tenacibaculum sp. M341]|uniref:phage tail protein n=1 Tax=Tenacibaculum sp. M341 TaxID=2530339 RepID=UPI00104F7975|nr:phage tail protein [Tenacibaculum sp. M341]TCI93207.1 phage tail protein [Tenacibaculum sp. M341]